MHEDTPDLDDRGKHIRHALEQQPDDEQPRVEPPTGSFTNTPNAITDQHCRHPLTMIVGRRHPMPKQMEFLVRASDSDLAMETHIRGLDHFAIAAAFEAVRDNNANASRRAYRRSAGVPDLHEAKTPMPKVCAFNANANANADAHVNANLSTEVYPNARNPEVPGRTVYPIARSQVRPKRRARVDLSRPDTSRRFVCSTWIEQQWTNCTWTDRKWTTSTTQWPSSDDLLPRRPRWASINAP